MTPNLKSLLAVYMRQSGLIKQVAVDCPSVILPFTSGFAPVHHMTHTHKHTIDSDTHIFGKCIQIYHVLGLKAERFSVQPGFQPRTLLLSPVHPELVYINSQMLK